MTYIKRGISQLSLEPMNRRVAHRGSSCLFLLGRIYYGAGAILDSGYCILAVLSDRTTRNYLRMGLQSGRKGRKWSFFAREVSQFLDDPFVQQALEVKWAAMVSNFLAKSHQTAAALCVIVDFPASDAAKALRLQELHISLVSQSAGAVRMHRPTIPHKASPCISVRSRKQILPSIEHTVKKLCFFQ